MPTARPKAQPRQPEASPDPAMTAEALAAAMADPLWRIRNIYTIRSEDGKPIPFRPNEEQERVMHEIYVLGTRVIVIPKARQLGLSTLLAIVCLDTILFGTSLETCLVDYNSNNAKKKLREKIFFAFDRLDPAIRKQFKVHSRSIQKGEFSVGPAGADVSLEQAEEEKPYSTFYAGEQPRGGTNQILWLSEWQETAARFPQRSEDILTGAWPTGEQGIRIIETTWHGGKRGEPWAIVSQGLDSAGQPIPPDRRRPGQPAVLFFPWWTKQAYRLAGSASLIRPETARYFAEKAKELAVEFDHEQQLWYQAQADTFGVFIKGQYPTTIHECWEAPVKGAILAEALAKAKGEGRVSDLPADPGLEVDTFWDLGAPDNTVCLYAQHLTGRRRLVACDYGLNMDLPDRLRHMAARGWTYGTHYLPHDAGARQRNGISYAAEFEAALREAGLSGRVVVLERCKSEWPGLNRLASLLANSLEVNEAECAKWIEAANLLRRKPDPSNTEAFLNEIVSDWTNHLADASRYLAEAEMAGYLPHNSSGTMTNSFFDETRLRESLARLPEHRPTTMALDYQGQTRRFLAARASQDGWLRVWQPPQPAGRYLVSVVANAVGVWRASSWDQAKASEAPTRMVAACLPEPGINRDRLLEWAALAAEFYGSCPVAVDVVSLPGSVETLQGHGAGVLYRTQPMEARRIGQATPVRRYGFELGPTEEEAAMAILQECWRDGLVELHCEATLGQMRNAIIARDNALHWPPDRPTHWARQAALALWQIGQAAPMVQAQAAGPGNSGLPRAGGKRKMA